MQDPRPLRVHRRWRRGGGAARKRRNDERSGEKHRKQTPAARCRVKDCGGLSFVARKGQLREPHDAFLSDEAPAEQVLIAATPSKVSAGTASARRRPLGIGLLPARPPPLIHGVAARCPAARGGCPVMPGPKGRVAMIRAIRGMILAAAAGSRPVKQGQRRKSATCKVLAGLRSGDGPLSVRVRPLQTQA